LPIWALFDPTEGKRLDRSTRRFRHESFKLEIVHFVIEVEGGGMTGAAARFAEEQHLAPALACGCLGRIESACHIELGSGREVEHVLHLGHMGHRDPIEDIHALLGRPNGVAIEVGSALLKLREVLHGAEAPLRAMNLLIKKSPKTGGIESK